MSELSRRNSVLARKPMSKARFTVRGRPRGDRRRSRRRAPELALDLGAGGGHVSYALARHARRVIASGSVVRDAGGGRADRAREGA